MGQKAHSYGGGNALQVAFASQLSGQLGASNEGPSIEHTVGSGWRPLFLNPFLTGKGLSVKVGKDSNYR